MKKQTEGDGSRFVLMVILISVMAIGCSPREETLPRIRYGEETCDRCRMIISEKRFASAYRTYDNILRKFDDLGCAVLHRAEQDEEIKQFWTYDYEETDWVDRAQAFFVHSKDLLTPMGYGIVAVKTEKKARQLVENTNGRIVEFDQLQYILRP